MSITFDSLGLKGAALLGCKIEIFWHDETDESRGTYYKGEIRECNILTNEHLIVYEDGDQDWYNITNIQYQIPLNEIKRIQNEQEETLPKLKNANIGRGGNKNKFSFSFEDLPSNFITDKKLKLTNSNDNNNNNNSINNNNNNNNNLNTIINEKSHKISFNINNNNKIKIKKNKKKKKKKRKRKRK